MKKQFLILAILFLSSILGFGQVNLNKNTILIDANGKITSGDATNSTQIDKTNGLILNGTATQWTDMTTSAIQSKVGSNNLPALNYDSLALEFVSDVDSNAIAYYVYQLPHTYKHFSSISPHVHWIQHNIGDTTWNMKIKYRIHPIGKQSGEWIWITTYDKYTIPFVSSPHHQIAEFPMIPLPTCNESSVIDILLYRYNNVGLSPVYVKMFDCHIEVEKMGTIEEYPTIN